MVKKSLALVLLALAVSVVLAVAIARTAIRPVRHESLSTPRIYAYRDWQSVGLHVHPGDVLRIRAQGTWLYTPGEYHGPQGHSRYGAPSFYPLPNVPGGALIGRIGDDGDPFYVGRKKTHRVKREGLLYLRIDDDILSDNEGYVTVQVTVTGQEDG
jgi:hypothetical protein